MTIKEIQQALINRGFNVGKSGADGIMGNNTKNAIIAFQKSKGLEPDGIVGKNTIAALLDNVIQTITTPKTIEPLSLERINKLHPKIREEIKAVLLKAINSAPSDRTLRVVQGLRTIEEQNVLYNQPWDGKDNDGDGKVDEKDEKVTNAKGGRSNHNYGLAIDICWLFDNGNGKYVYDDKRSWLVDEHFKKIVKIFNDAGYFWGGNFKSLYDAPHFEKTFGLTVQKMFDMYSTGKTFVDKQNNIKYINI